MSGTPRTRRRFRPLVALLGLAMIWTPFLSPADRAEALPDGLALTPPMGFNNWNSTGCAIDEKMIRDTADRIADSGLKEAGYEYVNVDDCWAAEKRDPATGRLTAHPERFPSGIKALADYVHARGLKFGIYTSAGTLTCARTMPGALDHEETDAQTFADWGVDYLKYDNCNNQGRPALERYTKMRDALKRTGRPIVYSLCEWGENKPWEWGADVGHLWRTTGDINDSWSSMLNLFKANAPLAGHAGPGRWNDPDMLEVGNGGMTATEYRSHFGLWSMMAAPLLIGTDLRKASPETFDILGNKDVIAVDQDRLGVQARVLRSAGGHWVLAKPLANGDVAVALFNETGTTATFGTTAKELGLPERTGYVLRDLWQHRDTETAGTVSAAVPAHGTAMFRISADADWWQAPPAADAALLTDAPAEGIPGTLTPAGRAFTATVRTTNHGRAPVLAPRLALTAPEGWRAKALGQDHDPVLTTGQSATARWRLTPPSDTPPGTAEATARLTFRSPGHGRVTRETREVFTVPEPVPTGVSALSDARWAAVGNGYGPVERDMSNGGAKAGDGRTLTVNGKTYPKGLGTHAPTELIYYLGGRCTDLTTDVGVDDERDPRLPGQGTLTAEIWADGTKRADSGLRTWQDPAVSLSADLKGADYLRLVGTTGGDSHMYDRLDWGGPTLRCGT
ncbi:NPCBM/NEW2 domain-containing protein [Streptomyces lasiicapitis]|uniref:Alpha-galactosidase n=2 Tax=Streptomyces lasiicapitis TaxID=1923961 RepID=A0ABQ2MAR9_9ACTN|nr:NPCBM/NEW2 domain-containing protein [Streptomyces lasiicapitis]GGO48910.1 alpha-galactosidase [Streptomyces lasiicapitis]